MIVATPRKMRELNVIDFFFNIFGLEIQHEPGDLKKRKTSKQNWFFRNFRASRSGYR